MYFVAAGVVAAFPNVNDERPVFRCPLKAFLHVAAERQRMRPPKTLHHANGEIVLEDLFVGVVMADRRNAPEKILDGSPEQPLSLGNTQVIGNGRLGGPIDILGPGFRIGIGPSTKLGEQTEFQVIMSVDQAGKNQAAFEIDALGVQRRLPTTRR